jgi:hypothetical protein
MERRTKGKRQKFAIFGATSMCPAEMSLYITNYFGQAPFKLAPFYADQNKKSRN